MPTRFVAAVDKWGAIMYLSGDFDHDSYDRFDQAFRALMETGAEKLTIDLTRAGHLGSAGLGRLAWARDVRPNVVLRGLSPEHSRLLEAAGMAETFATE